MSEEAGFLAALAARPHDETTRLVFADWLEERGDPRALWVRDAELFAWATPTLNDPLPALLKALGKQRTRAQVTYALSKLGDAVLPSVITAFRSSDAAVREHAREVLHSFGAAAVAILPDLREQMNSIDLAVRREAIVSIGFLGAAAVSELPWLIHQLRAENIEVFKATVEALEKFGPAAASAIPALIEANARVEEWWEEFANWEHGTAVLNAIVATQSAAPEVINLLAANLNHYNYDASLNIASHLRTIGISAIEAILDNIPRLDSDRTSVATGLVWDLGEAAVPYLLKRLQSEDWDDRCSALIVLGNRDEDARIPESLHPAVPLIANFIQHAYAYDLEFAISALRRFGQAAHPAVTALRERAESDLSSEDRGNIIELLAIIDVQFDVKADLRARLTHEQATIRHKAADCIWHTDILTEDERRSFFELALNSPDAKVRATAASNLLINQNRLTEERLPLVLLASQDASVEVRETLLARLPARWESPPPQAFVDMLLSLLHDKVTKVRARAITAMGNIVEKDASHLPTLVPFLKDRSPTIRVSAAKAVLTRKDLDANTYETIARLLEDLRPSLQGAVLESLQGHKIPALLAPVLVALLDHSKNAVVLTLAVLAHLTDPPTWVCDALRQRLPRIKSWSDIQRRQILSTLVTLSACGGLTAAEIPLLMSLLDEDCDKMAEMLGKLGAPGVTALRDRLRAGGAGRKKATWILGEIGPQAVAALPELVVQLADVEQSLVRTTLHAISQIGPAAGTAVPVVAPLLRDAKLAKEAIACLIGLGDAVLPHLAQITQIWRRDDCRDPGQFAQLFCHLGQYAPAVVPMLGELIAMVNSWERAPIIRRLGDMGPAAAEAVPELLRALNDTHKDNRVEAATALGKIGVVSEDVLDELRQKTRHDKGVVAKAAQKALKQLGASKTPRPKREP